MTLTWDDPGKDVYIASYRYTTDGGDTWTEIPDSQSTVQGQLTRYTVPNLTNGQAYTFAVLAENAIGTSPPSATVTATPEGGPPAKPTGLSAAPRNAEATLTWDDPSDASITNYQVKQGNAAWADISSSSASTTSHTVGTLTNGTSYTFQIRAVNDHDGDNTDDPGPASDAVTVTPGLPTAPASLSVAPGDAQVILTWSAPASDGGSAVTGYEYTSNADAATPTWTDVPDSGSGGANETEYTVTSLVNNTAYAFAVRAENANGQGPATPTLRATPVPPGTPQRPARLKANPGHEQVRLTWALPAVQHPVTSYEYRQSTDGGTTWTLWTEIDDSDATTTEHLLTGLTNDTTYTFELRALKDSTAGPSARAQATPSRTAADEVIDRGSSGQLTSPTGGTYTVTQISPPAGLNWRIAVPGTTEIDDRTFIVRSLQGGTPETSPRYTFTSTGQEGLDIQVDPRLDGRAQVCLEPSQLLGREAGSQPLLVLRYNGTSMIWEQLQDTTTDGGMVCGTTSAFSAFVLVLRHVSTIGLSGSWSRAETAFMPQKKYIVRLTAPEREVCQQTVRKLSGSSEKARRAQILLKADADGPGWTDQQIADALSCRTKTVENVRQRCVQEGFERALERKRRALPPGLKRLDGEQEAQVIALRLGSPPEGYANWSLRLLARRVVELGVVESVSHETIRRTLKKTR